MQVHYNIFLIVLSYLKLFEQNFKFHIWYQSKRDQHKSREKEHHCNINSILLLFFFFKQICTAKESVITNHTIQQSRATLILYTAEQKHSHIRMLRVRQLYWWTPNRFYLQRTFCCGEKKKKSFKVPFVISSVSLIQNITMILYIFTQTCTARKWLQITIGFGNLFFF